MSITAQCGGCQKQFKLDDKWAGRKVRCKACGGVIEVPGAAAAAASRRATVSAAPPAGAPDDSPFDNLDALMSLEQNATVQDAPPLPTRGGRPAPRPAPAAAETDGILAALPTARPMRRRGPKPAAAPVDYAPAPGWKPMSDAYVTIPGEDAIDSYVPLITSGTIVVLLFLPLGMLIYSLTRLPENVKINWNAVGRAVGYWAGGASVTAIFVFGVMTGLALLGVHIASQILSFAKLPNIYRRCAATVCAPAVVPLILAAIRHFADDFTPPSPLAILALMLVALYGVMWLMMRMKLVPYLVSAGFITLFVIVAPFLFLLILGKGLEALRFK